MSIELQVPAFVTSEKQLPLYAQVVSIDGFGIAGMVPVKLFLAATSIKSKIVRTEIVHAKGVHSCNVQKRTTCSLNMFLNMSGGMFPVNLQLAVN